ncbi:hypothetical protein [Listeria monocytogenes]|uniref:hypothetical protein n=2 Tax=Listeria monocytogenes TaxID=1639 RepID=UPI0008755F66|nr:hypothetical protein [Listeria monocytogenes]EAC6409174.1 hypothetical protein [Listeria monocytogenes]EAD1642373.1 hypothetical protein [Listeria monocytogenes]EAD1645226.1 hypothetical protein [Listeria monocytogenes]EAD1661114.1 hypothetical protein [Listeria monocytogenes]EAD3477349.1 hypothetical protein [Listeria monocytogenes]
MIDINAPIIPWKEAGGIKLYSTIRDVKEIVEDKDVSGVLLNKFWVRYEIKDEVFLFFHLLNGKLFKITTLKNYKGQLFDNVQYGMSAQELLAAHPDFIYDDIEEVYESKSGAFLEVDFQKGQVTYISVYIKELDNADFEEANW